MKHKLRPTGGMLERRLIEKATARFDLPVTHLVSSYGMVAEGAPA
jgi:hypothetical protein